MKDASLKIAGIDELAHAIQKADQFFIDQTQRTVNSTFTLRNWIIGYYLDPEKVKIVQTMSGQAGGVESLPISMLLNRLSFSHFIELITADGILKRMFYETEAIRNNWSVRELQRAMSSMLFERTGLSSDKEAVLENHRKGSGLKPADVFRSPYLLDFLGLEEKPDYVETDLEQAIINNMQKFLLEMGRGFCFEARLG